MPIVNLFTKLAEPIRLARTKTQYLVVPDARRPQAMEVYSIDEVKSIHPDTKEEISYQPFYALHDKTGSRMTRRSGTRHRQPAPSVADPGTDVYLVMVDSNFDPTVPASEVVSVRATCTNRNLPADVQKTGSVDWQFQLAGQSPVRRITTPVDPTPPCGCRGRDQPLAADVATGPQPPLDHRRPRRRGGPARNPAAI